MQTNLQQQKADQVLLGHCRGQGRVRRKVLGGDGYIFITSIVVMISQVFIYDKTSQMVPKKYMQFITGELYLLKLSKL